jgi:hypothetical protein
VACSPTLAHARSREAVWERGDRGSDAVSMQERSIRFEGAAAGRRGPSGGDGRASANDVAAPALARAGAWRVQDRGDGGDEHHLGERAKSGFPQERRCQYRKP